MRNYTVFYREMERFAEGLGRGTKRAEVFRACIRVTLETTVRWPDGEDPFLVTGDIPAMWLRDSSFQVRPYLLFADRDPDLAALVRGLVRRQMSLILLDPYANAFNAGPDGPGFPGDVPAHSPWVWERKYEIDSLCLPFLLACDLADRTGDRAVFDDRLQAAFRVVLDLWTLEQDHGTRSAYRFLRPGEPPEESLRNAGAGLPVNRTGMTWAGFRPSDDPCTFGFHIPGNMLAVVALRRMAPVCRSDFRDAWLADRAEALADGIDTGIRTFGIVEHPAFGRIFAYETDGFGNHLLIDDANVPSLLSAPYIGYCAVDDPVYRNTRRFLLGDANPYHFSGNAARGIGSRHTPDRHIWPIALMVQALTAETAAERDALVETLLATDAGTGHMHESFHADDPAVFTRPWFAWADSLFAELLLAHGPETRIR